MPRIVPVQLLHCLKILLDENGGILNSARGIRLASLMTKFSRNLVSKCIYVQILKCTKTELLGGFMGVGGWSLVYTWLNDAIRAMNWPLVQEILELLLLCPVDVHRLKINSAPKLVKGLCKDGGNAGVRILAKRLVEQWLKVVTENPEATLPTPTMTQQLTAIKPPTVAVVAPEAISVNVQQQQTSLVNSTDQNTPPNVQQQQLQQKKEEKKTNQKLKSNKKSNKEQDFVQQEEEEEDKNEDNDDDEEEEEENSKENEADDQDPLGGVGSEPAITNYTLTPAQKKASESGLVYKFIIRDGQSILAKVPPKSIKPVSPPQEQSSMEEEEEEEAESNAIVNEDETKSPEDAVDNSVVNDADENSSSLDRTEKDNESNSGSEGKPKIEDTKKEEVKKSNQDIEKSNVQKDRRSSKDNKERRSSSSSSNEKEKDKDTKVAKSSSSSSSHRSSSSHKSSKSSSSSSSKSKSSSSHRSSSDKHRSDKERSGSSKEKEKDRSSSSSSSSSSKHKSSSSSSKSSSSSSSSKDKYRDKDKSSSSSSSKGKDKQEQSQSEKDRNTLDKVTSSSSSLDKLGKIPKKIKDEPKTANDSEISNKSTSITIPSKKASMSIEIRKDTEKAKTVKTYKSQFRSHGLTEEAPPPPSRKGLKKPSSSTPPGTVLPSSLPSSLKRTSPPRDSPSEKKAKIDINNVSVVNEKPGAIKLIPPKKIQTLVETNLFSDALSAATGPKKVIKRKRPSTPLVNGKEGLVSPTSPDAPKVVPLKFYQDTLDESKVEDSKPNKENEEAPSTTNAEDATKDDKDIEDDDDIPLKKVKEDIEQKVAKEKKLDCVDIDVKTADTIKDEDEEKLKIESSSSPIQLEQQQNSPKVEENDDEIVVEKRPGPGCGPNGPPGVLMLHRRKGPKKKLSWRPQETLEQIRYFELDENERCNVTKTSFMDMKNLEHFNERDAIVMARRGFNHEDNMDVQTHWKPLMEVDDVPPHPEGNQSKQRKIQADRELTTLRALYFTHALIPDSPAEAEFEPAFNHDVPLIPLDDLTGNPDAVNDFTSMPWPEPRGSPKQGDNSMSGTGGLGSPVNMFGSPTAQVVSAPNNNKQSGGNPYNPFVNPFGGNQGPNVPNGPPMQNSPQNQWQGPGNVMGGMGNTFNRSHGSPIMDIGAPGSMGPGPMMNNGPPQNFMNQFSPNFSGPPNPFMGGPSGFNNGPNNFGPMGPNGPIMNGMGPGPILNNFAPQMMNVSHNNRNNRGNNNGGNWRSGGSNFQDNWRPAGPGPNNRGGGGGIGNNGVCKAYMRGHCRLGNSCKYIHPNKSKRI